MCLSVYIATSEKLETSKFIEDETYFYVEEEKNTENLVDKFSYPNIYYLGSYTGCSCGFCFDFDDEDWDDDEDNQWGKESLEQMFNFFRNEITRLKEIEMFVCWEGDEDCHIEERRIIELSKFEFGRKFEFKQLEFIKFTQ